MSVGILRIARFEYTRYEWVEEWKVRKPISAGVPVWFDDGLISTGAIYKSDRGSSAF